MNKYIDADCLRTEIKNLIEKYSSIKAKGVIQEGYKGGRLIGYEDILHKLDSLQQEQRETDEDDGKFVKILVRKELAEQIQRLGDEIHAGQSSFIGAMNQQEQPEVDLEREAVQFCFDKGLNVTPHEAKTIAYYFYELGQRRAAEMYDEIEYNRQRAEEENK